MTHTKILAKDLRLGDRVTVNVMGGSEDLTVQSLALDPDTDDIHVEYWNSVMGTVNDKLRPGKGLRVRNR